MSKNINEEWKEYYNFLEGVRRTGICNMFGASIFLEEAFHISHEEANKILTNWMENYSELYKKYNWQETLEGGEK